MTKSRTRPPPGVSSGTGEAAGESAREQRPTAKLETERAGRVRPAAGPGSQLSSLSEQLKAEEMQRGQLTARLNADQEQLSAIEDDLTRWTEVLRELTAAVKAQRRAQQDALRQARSRSKLIGKLKQDVNAYNKAQGKELQKLKGEIKAYKLAEIKAKARDKKFKKDIAARKQTLQAMKASTSWRITTPLRAVATRLRWLGRNTRRGFVLLGWVFTGQFKRAGAASKPYVRKALSAAPKPPDAGRDK